MRVLSGYTCPVLATAWATIMRLRGRVVRADDFYSERLSNGGWAEIRLPFPDWMILAECGFRNWSMRTWARLVLWRQPEAIDRSEAESFENHRVKR